MEDLEYKALLQSFQKLAPPLDKDPGPLEKKLAVEMLFHKDIMRGKYFIEPYFLETGQQGVKPFNFWLNTYIVRHAAMCMSHQEASKEQYWTDFEEGLIVIGLYEHLSEKPVRCYEQIDVPVKYIDMVWRAMERYMADPHRNLRSLLRAMVPVLLDENLVENFWVPSADDLGEPEVSK